jgi:hypothetical protein
MNALPVRVFVDDTPDLTVEQAAQVHNPDALEPPIVEQFSTDVLGAGLKVTAHGTLDPEPHDPPGTRTLWVQVRYAFAVPTAKPWSPSPRPTPTSAGSPAPRTTSTSSSDASPSTGPARKTPRTRNSPRAVSLGYRIVLPPVWAGIPLLSGTEEAIAAILDAAAAELPAPPDPDRRGQVADQLRTAAAEARANNGVHLYLPIATVHDITTPATIAVFDISFGALDPLDPELLTERLAATPNAGQVIIAGAVCSRVEETYPPDPARGAPLPSRRVEYLLPFPDDPDRWVLVVCTALRTDDSAGDRSTEWVAVFDAMMTTFRWRAAEVTGRQ